jgi:hypothetical protein
MLAELLVFSVSDLCCNRGEVLPDVALNNLLKEVPFC